MKTTKIAIDNIRVRIKGGAPAAPAAFASAIGRHLLERLNAPEAMGSSARGTVRIGSVDAGTSDSASPHSIAGHVAGAIAKRSGR